VASQVRPIRKSQADSISYSEAQMTDPVPGMSYPKANASLTALSVEFVAKPEEARRAEHSIPASIDASLREFDGYAGCLVMISNQEARLITVITFWSGPRGSQLCQQNTRWVNALLKPFMDRCLRSQTVFARLPAQSPLRPDMRQEMSGGMEKTVTFENDLLTVA
jgi:hypothetical protein